MAQVKQFAWERDLSLDWMGLQGDDCPKGLIPSAEGEQLLCAYDVRRVQGVEVYSAKGKKGTTILNWDLAAAINCRDSSAVLCCTREKFPVSTINSELINSFLNCIESRYGIGYERPLHKGPNLYAVGMVTGLGASVADWQEADAIGKWLWEGINGQAYMKGKLRDVYPCNILSDVHLLSPVDGVSLADWIRQDGERGVLSPLNNGLWLWKVESHALFPIQRELGDNGLLISR